MISPTTGILFLSYRYCILNEVWRLVADGILNVEEIDNVMSEGLGMRYAFLGPLETAHLNAEGISEGMAFLVLAHNIHNILDPPSLLSSALRVWGK
jgi:3-hydroxyacyl-CoA dehydrogenase